MLIYYIEVILYIFLAVTILIIVALFFFRKKYKDQIKFLITGLDSGFNLTEILMLWKVSRVSKYINPIKLYYSTSELNNSIMLLIKKAKSEGTEKTRRIQTLLSKLYNYRTKIEIESNKKRGIDSTRDLSIGQRLRIILPGLGVFSSKIKNNSRELAIGIPLKRDFTTISIGYWIGKEISVYLWRQSDAAYVFDTTVYRTGMFRGDPVLYLAHTNQLLRTQKRQTVRNNCKIYADLYFLDEYNSFNSIETRPGYRCLIEDISESGAMVRIGGKGVSNIKIKLQFHIEFDLVIMFGIVRAVEYNKNINQSRLHFECTNIDPSMKNIILTFVYKVLPSNEQEIYEAMTLTEKDASENAGTDDDGLEDVQSDIQKVEKSLEENKKVSDSNTSVDVEKLHEADELNFDSNEILNSSNSSLENDEDNDL